MSQNRTPLATMVCQKGAYRRHRFLVTVAVDRVTGPGYVCDPAVFQESLRLARNFGSDDGAPLGIARDQEHGARNAREYGAPGITTQRFSILMHPEVELGF